MAGFPELNDQEYEAPCPVKVGEKVVFKLIEGVAGESENVELGTATEMDADIGEDWPQAF